MGTWLSGKFSEFSSVVPVKPMCGSDGLASEGQVVELDGVVVMPAMTVPTALRSVASSHWTQSSPQGSQVQHADLAWTAEGFRHLLELGRDIRRASHCGLSLRSYIIFGRLRFWWCLHVLGVGVLGIRFPLKHLQVLLSRSLLGDLCQGVCWVWLVSFVSFPLFVPY